MASFLRLSTVLLLSALLVTAAGCVRSRRGRTDGGTITGRDGGGPPLPPPPPGGSPVEDGLAASMDLADTICPCQVESGEYETIASCVADVAPSSAFIGCSRTQYEAMRSGDLDLGLNCRVAQLRSIDACVGTMGCAALFDCLGGVESCADSPAFDAFDAAVDSCVGGDPPPPPPGMCTPLSTGSGVGSALFTGATSGTGALSGSCGGESAPEAVHIWNAPSAGTFVIDTVGSDFDTLLYVFDGSCTGAELGCNDDTSSVQSEVTVTVAAGQALYVVVDGFGSGSGSYVVNVSAASATP